MILIGHKNVLTVKKHALKTQRFLSLQMPVAHTHIILVQEHVLIHAQVQLTHVLKQVVIQLGLVMASVMEMELE